MVYHQVIARFQLNYCHEDKISWMLFLEKLRHPLLNPPFVKKGHITERNSVLWKIKIFEKCVEITT